MSVYMSTHVDSLPVTYPGMADGAAEAHLTNRSAGAPLVHSTVERGGWQWMGFHLIHGHLFFPSDFLASRGADFPGGWLTGGLTPTQICFPQGHWLSQSSSISSHHQDKYPQPHPWTPISSPWRFQTKSLDLHPDEHFLVFFWM